MPVPRLGALFLPQRPPEALPGFAQAVEALGLDALWVVEDCFDAGGLTAAAIALGATRELRVGTGLLPVALRNPALAAMELATLGRVHPGRFTAAFGHGVEAWMRQIGARPPDRIVALEETVSAVRRLLAGERVTVAGRHVRVNDVVLGHPPDPAPPILVGTTGPAGLAVAGRAADGLLLPEGSGAAAVTWARERLAQAGQVGEVTVYAWLSVDDDEERALAPLRSGLESWQRLYPRLAALAGAGEGAPLGDEALRSIAVAGDAAACARAIAALGEAGAATVVLLPRPGEEQEQLERVAREVRPLLGA